MRRLLAALGAGLAGAASLALLHELYRRLDVNARGQRQSRLGLLARHFGAGVTASALYSFIVSRRPRLHTQQLPFSRAAL